MEAILDHFFDELEYDYELALRETLHERALKRAFLVWKALAIRRKTSKSRPPSPRKPVQAQRRKEQPPPAERRTSLRKSLSRLFQKLPDPAIPSFASGGDREEEKQDEVVVVFKPRNSLLTRALSFSRKRDAPEVERIPPLPANPPLPHELQFDPLEKVQPTVFQLEHSSQPSPLFHFRNSRAASAIDKPRTPHQQLQTASSSHRISAYYKLQREQVEVLERLNAKRKLMKERKKSQKQSAIGL